MSDDHTTKFAATRITEQPDFNGPRFTLSEFMEFFGLAWNDPGHTKLVSASEVHQTLAINRASFPGNNLLTVAQCLTILGIGRTLFYTLLSKGEIIAVKVGRRTYVRMADLVHYIDSLPTFQRSLLPSKAFKP